MKRIQLSSLFILLILQFVPAVALTQNDSAAILSIRKLYEAGNINTALEKLNALIKSNSSNEEALYERGKIFTEQRKYLDAIKDFNRVLELNPINQKAYYLRGYTKFLMGSNKAAIDDFNLSLELHSAGALALWYRAEAKIKIGDTRGACEDWDLAYKYGYSNASKRIQNHCKNMEMSADVAADVFLRKGDEKMNNGDFRGALTEYQKALELAPESGMVLYNVGLAKFVLKDRTGACSFWQKAAQNKNDEARQMHKQHCE